uniref:RNA helicase n=1 Tax=Aegilops tauschii subsp. strangulata TaxID=200361 RepID=A0A453P5B6_AEGTS
LAYLLPILSEIGPLKRAREQGNSEKRSGIEAVVVAPSRELGMQIVREVEKILGPDDKRLVQQLVGGANRSRQEEALKKNKPIIVVGTPGRISEISAAVNQAAVDSLPPSLEHYYCTTKAHHKVDTLRRCIHALEAETVIAFMNNTKPLKDVVFKLEARGMKAIELHGDLGKLARSTVLKKFKAGEFRVLVTNELSARGLDIPECDLVINLDLPTDSTHYAHRAGRTGRLGRKGTVVSICEESEAFIMRKMRKQLGVAIKPCEFTEGQITVHKEEDVE